MGAWLVTTPETGDRQCFRGPGVLVLARGVRTGHATRCWNSLLRTPGTFTRRAGCSRRIRSPRIMTASSRQTSRHLQYLFQSLAWRHWQAICPRPARS